MKRKISPVSTVTGYIILTTLIAAVVTVDMFVYAAVNKASGGNNAVVAGVMLAVIIALSVICTLIDYFRRKFTVNKTVNEILEATDKIAAGDFSVRLQTVHTLNRYDEYDYIIENLNKMSSELAHIEVLQTDFVSNVSHEIKTPLAVIQNYATLMQSANLDEAMRIQYAETLAGASKRLTALISNILKLNKLENQEIKPDHEQINLTGMLAECVLGFEDIVEQKDIELDCDFEDDVQIKSSASYLEIVWNNLLSNAIKFTEPKGKITVSLKSENEKAVVKVADTGCGISADTGRHIFEKFYQGDTSHSQEGNGLGLALVKKVIDILGGEISVESEVGKGTAFTVRLKKEL